MSSIHLRSHTLLLWLSLSAVATASVLVTAGCSSSDADAAATAGKGSGGGHAGGATGNSGGSTSDAGDPGTGEEPDQTPDETGEGGRIDTPSGGGSGGTDAVGGANVNGGSPSSGDAGETGEGGAAGAPVTGDPELEAAQARAVALINAIPADSQKCFTCHQKDYSGLGFYPNISPDIETGIGSWTDEEIKTAIRDGKDNEGKTLCATMTRYDFTDAQLSDLVIYLKHLAPVKKKISVKCPSL